MPNRDAHDKLGALAGPGYCLASAAANNATVSGWELFGSLLSSLVTSHLPDALEPPTNPNHRATCHSVTGLGVLIFLLAPRLEAERNKRRDLAAQCRWKAAWARTPEERERHLQESRQHELIAGALAGAIPGYASHLIADSQTPKGLPLI
jgi:membrane-bound metal-dependent hydrolase YbcI (DUF457 family)